MSEVTTTIVEPGPKNPFAKALQNHVSAGAVAIESERAVAEAQGRLIIAKRFPRDPFAAYGALMDACQRLSFAKGSMYSFPKGGKTTAGPSIRLAEEMARCWGNIEYGIRELSRRGDESEMEAYAWDQQTNVLSKQAFTVKHIRDKREGGQKLTEERDIYEITANMGARRLRARILAIMPADLVEACVEECRKTVRNGGGLTLADRIKEALDIMAGIDVTADMIAAHLGRPISTMTVEDIVDLQGIYQSIKDGLSTVREHFVAKAGPPASGGRLDQLERQIAGKQPAPASDDDFPGDRP